MGNKVHVLMPIQGGKKKLIEVFEGQRTHQLALEGKNGYAMPGAEQVAQEQKKKQGVKSVAAKESNEELPTENPKTGEPKIEGGIEDPKKTEQSPKKDTTEKKPRKTKSK